MPRTRAVIEYVIDRSLLLVAGTVVALVWANLDVTRYSRFADALQFGVNEI